jgi:hypothetical protein
MRTGLSYHSQRGPDELLPLCGVDSSSSFVTMDPEIDDAGRKRARSLPPLPHNIVPRTDNKFSRRRRRRSERNKNQLYSGQNGGRISRRLAATRTCALHGSNVNS